LIRSFIAASFCLWLAVAAHGQNDASNRAELAWADSVSADLEENRERPPARILALTERLMRIYAQARDTCKLGRLSTFRSRGFEQLGQLDSAMACMQRSFDLFRPGCDSLGLMRAYLAKSNVYLSLGENVKVDSIGSEALRLWNPAWKFQSIRNGLVTNQAIARAGLGDLAGALSAFRMVYRLAKEGNNLADMDVALTNIGVIKEMSGDIDSSDHYYRLAFSAARAKGDSIFMVKQWMNLGYNRAVVGDHRAALHLMDSAMVMAKRKGMLEERVNLEKWISDSYLALGRPDSAVVRLKSHLALKDSLLGIERVKVLADMQEKYESEKKEKEILGLKADNLEKDLRDEQRIRSRNIYISIGVVALLLAIGLWSRLQFVHKSKAAIQKEKDISEGLLLNILPEEVAAELKQKGEAEARLIDEVTVLFTDFKGFTAMSEKLTPKELVRDIHECFSAFDHIMVRNGMEKIKTIGDAYMAAGGLPVPNNTHAGDAVRAALELRDFIEQGKKDKIAKGLLYFEVRIGIHTGPVVAGIVGVKKFAYDIWGDTVNTASRMESSGEPGRVNISQYTYQLIKDDPSFSFEPRGKVQAKGKGEVEMWFVERA